MTRLELFSAIRPFAPGQKLTPAMVTMIDDLADRFGLARVDGPTGDWLPHALGLIKQFEGCELKAYPDPGSGGDPWTIGWGATGKDIVRGLVWTQAQADERLARDVTKFGEGVDGLLRGAPTTVTQKGALVSLAYNIGLENLRTSTLLRLHKEGDYAGATGQFARWNKAAGKVMNGLTRRREAEAKVYGA